MNFPVKEENNGYMPPSFKVNDYLNHTQQLNVVGGTILSGSFQGFDQRLFNIGFKSTSGLICWDNAATCLNI